MSERTACDYCGKPAEKTTGRVVYPHLPKLAEKEVLEGNMELAAELALRSEARALAAEAALATERERADWQPGR